MAYPEPPARVGSISSSIPPNKPLPTAPEDKKEKQKKVFFNFRRDKGDGESIKPRCNLASAFWQWRGRWDWDSPVVHLHGVFNRLSLWVSWLFSLVPGKGGRPEISSPHGFEHTVHVGFDAETGEFSVSDRPLFMFWFMSVWKMSVCVRPPATTPVRLSVMRILDSSWTHNWFFFLHRLVGGRVREEPSKCLPVVVSCTASGCSLDPSCHKNTHTGSGKEI